MEGLVEPCEQTIMNEVGFVASLVRNAVKPPLMRKTYVLSAQDLGSSATLVKDELIRNILFFAIRSWSHTDLFPILLLQILSPKSMDSQTQVQSTLVSERLERGSSMRTSGQGSLPLAMSHRSMPFPVHFFSACDLVPLLFKMVLRVCIQPIDKRVR